MYVLKRLEARVFRAFKKVWMPLLLIVVVAAGAYAVIDIRNTMGAHPLATGAAGSSGDTKPFHPKRITYEINGSGGTVSVNYLDENGQPHLVDAAPLPWTYTIVTTLPSMSANIVA